MASLPKYECDGEFHKLMMRRSDVDLTVAALELARDVYPGLDFDPTLDWIASRAAELAGSVARAKTDAAALQSLSRCLGTTHGLLGECAVWKTPDGSCLNRVVETGRGIPISLSLLYMAVARRVGIDLKGVAAPGHFLCRYETSHGPLFVDAYEGGRVLTLEQVVPWLCRKANRPPYQVQASLGEASPRTIIIRMLNNLKAVHAGNHNWQQAWMVQHRLTALQPCVYEERRDLAILSVRANQHGSAIDLLESCLKTCPQEDRELLELSLAEANTQLSRWN
jgi:regulator of sirC expression with transglutaminase-like and TPR domain